MNRLARNNRTQALLTLLVLSCASGCGSQEGKPGGAVQYYELKGLVMALEPSRNRVIIAHEEIPHFMKAMTMSFTIKDTSLLQGIEVGDSVRGVLEVRRPDVWLDSLTVVENMTSSKKVE
ncbi:MAG: copper-binding protein [Ignavibacteria bacterium]|nr:copper-binding protein [Ignavibacteria bacterium]